MYVFTHGKNIWNKINSSLFIILAMPLMGRRKRGLDRIRVAQTGLEFSMLPRISDPPLRPSKSTTMTDQFTFFGQGSLNTCSVGRH